jgi:hypothetical protein
MRRERRGEERRGSSTSSWLFLVYSIAKLLSYHLVANLDCGAISHGLLTS